MYPETKKTLRHIMLWLGAAASLVACAPDAKEDDISLKKEKLTAKLKTCLQGCERTEAIDCAKNCSGISDSMEPQEVCPWVPSLCQEVCAFLKEERLCSQVCTIIEGNCEGTQSNAAPNEPNETPTVEVLCVEKCGKDCQCVSDCEGMLLQHGPHSAGTSTEAKSEGQSPIDCKAEYLTCLETCTGEEKCQMACEDSLNACAQSNTAPGGLGPF
jgi:hypothetical protein